MAGNALSCASCGTANAVDARFCEGCGGPLARVCGACGVEASGTARFCRGCGASLDATDEPVAKGPVRRTVTVMFADLAGSTSFEERVDAETAREVIGQYHELLRSTAQRHRAGVTKYIGDGFMAVWGVPETGADDAGHAIDTAVELQERFVDLAARVTEAHGVELALRVAVNTGEVVVGSGDADLVGDAINVAARLEGECPRGHVVVGEETRRATRGQHSYDALGQVQVKGRTTPVAVFQWLGRHAESPDAAAFVGRTDEVRRLHATLDEATVARAARMVTVIGDPGVGKTRLAAALIETRPGLRAIQTRCNVAETVALAPIVELLRSRDLDADVPAGTPERDRMLRDLNGLAAGVPGSVEETFWALRRFVEALAADGPLLFVVDDLQWADALLLDFVEHLLEWVSEVPVLVVALARPELREVRADFVAMSRWVTESVHLRGLDSAATAQLAAEVLGGASPPDELLRRLPSSTGGNPLFVRELIGMLVDDEVLVREPTGWRLTIDVDAISIPPTIHALLASRLERLDAVDRRVLEIASVLGTDFSLGAVAVLSGRGAPVIKTSLDRLRRLQLAQPSGAYVGDEPVWRFHHVLIRDVAYRRLLKSDRAELHEALANWVEAGGATLASDPDEMIARHLESAHGYRLELGSFDDRAGDLALRSARCYLASARRALDRDELASAGSQAARGAALGTDEDALRAELLLIGCEAFLSAGDVATCAPLVDDLEGVAGERLAPWATCYRCQFVVYTEPERLLEVEARLQGAIDEFDTRKDAAGLAKAYRVRAGARARLGRVGDAETDLLEALIAARKSGDQRQITAALSAAPSAALWGPSPVPKAGGRCLDVVRMQRMATAAPSLEATSLRCLAVLELLRGRPDKARSMLADARQVVADLGLRHGLMETELFAGIIEAMVGDPIAAEPHFRAALDGLGALGAGADAGLAAALLARSVLAQGRVETADSYAAESERLAGYNLKTAIAWRAVRAEILCAQGSYDEAIDLAHDAVAVAGGTDLVLDHADACLALGRVLAAAGDAQGADGARRDAESLYAAKQVVGTIGQSVRPVAPPMESPPPEAAAPMASRLAVANRASEMWQSIGVAMSAHDVDAVVGYFADELVHDDQRSWSGGPLADVAERRSAMERYLAHYSHNASRTLAVRGDCLALSRTRSSDDAGNEMVQLHLVEVGDDGQVCYWGQFDEDDFEAALTELETRYYAGEGAAYAEIGLAASGSANALNQGDFDRLFGELTTPDMRVENRSRSVFPDRSANDLRASFGELDAMVFSTRTWTPVVCWLSPAWSVVRFEREAVGHDGELYGWTKIFVTEHCDGRFASMTEFDLDDEDAAFTYAEERVRATTSRLPVTNRASESVEAVWLALRAHDIDGAIAKHGDRTVYDDRRAWRLGGDPFVGLDAMRQLMQRLLESYPHVEWRTLAVRGERLELASGRWSDDAGNEATYLHVYEIGDDDRIAYHGRFDEDDFEGAYRELDRRYYAGEGLPFAQGGAVATEWTVAHNRGDLDRVYGELSDPDFRAVSRSRSVFGDRSAVEHRASVEELAAMVASVRSWLSAVRWLSLTVCVARFEREAVGLDGEEYAWTELGVGEFRDGRFASVCNFDPDDEDAAFAYAEERLRATTSRVAVTNQSCEFVHKCALAMRAHDVDATLRLFSDRFTHDDHRRLTGYPIVGVDAVRTTFEQIFEQYTQFEFRVLATRGERLSLVWTRWSDDDGNESNTFVVDEIGEDRRVTYEGRFDEDDFEGAYRELDRRYYSGEGAAFAGNGAVSTEWMMAVSRGDFDTAFGQLSTPDFRVTNRSRSLFGDRSATEYRASIEELAAIVTSMRGWHSAVHWLSPTWSVTRYERETVGLDGEHYSWTQLLVAEVRDGRLASICQFEVDDEDEAFAYAEERVSATASLLSVTNQASETWVHLTMVMEAHDAAAAAAHYSDGFTYDDRRGWSGDPIEGDAAWRAGLARFLAQYSHHEGRVLAVRGARLAFTHSSWSDDAGNQTDQLHVIELDDDGRIGYQGRFDEDAFDGAYRELERRYYAGEGAAFAEGGSTMTDGIVGLNQGDLDRVFGELVTPEMGVENRSLSVLPNRSASFLHASFAELDAMVASVRTWLSAVRWISPVCCVTRFDREANGRDGEQYAWTHVVVLQIRAGLVSSACEFELDDEDAAFAYAEELVAARPSRLALANRASEVGHDQAVAMAAHDVDAVLARFSDRWVYDDRRGLSGDPIEGVAAQRTAVERVFEQYSHFEGRTLAVRGERLALGRSRWSDDAGNETVHLHVAELGEDERIVYEGRFDDDDFEGAYRELDRRYYAGEGVAFAQSGAVATESMIAMSRGDTDTASGELMTPDFQLTNRSRSVFGDRSRSEFRASIEELASMVGSVRAWHSAVHWLSPTCCAARFEREAVGLDGEQYSWTRLLVGEVRDGRVASTRLFEIDDEEEAFAYAEERVRASTSRLAVANRASETWLRGSRALEARDIDAAAGHYTSDRLVHDDRREWSGDQIKGAAAWRAGLERFREQYSRFEGRALAVRGARLALTWSSWSDDAGNETVQLHVIELDDDGRIGYWGRFDEDDFEGAYRELDRRYYADEGAAFAESGALQTDYVIALNRGELDKVFGELSTPDFGLTSRSRSVFGDRSAAQLRATQEELAAMVDSARSWTSAICWLSPACCVIRMEREAVEPDGQKFAWTKLYACAERDGRLASVCEFEVDDEDAAFAYAVELVGATTSQLAVANRATAMLEGIGRAAAARNADAIVAYYSSDRFVYDDRRGFSGDPVESGAAWRVAVEQVLEQFSQFEAHVLAVRGDHLALCRNRRSDDAGNETIHLVVYEVGDDGRIIYEGRFDEDDLESAYRELERRYYDGEGAVFAAGGSASTEVVIALNRGDFDRAFGEFLAADFRLTSRSRSVFGDRSAAETRVSIEELAAMVTSVRMLFSAVRWLSPTCCVVRQERQAVGLDDEQYSWTRLYVAEFRGGRFASMCEFELENEQQAFAYAENLAVSRPSRLAVSNLATESELRMSKLWGQPGYESAMSASTYEHFQVVDRRAMPAAPCRGREAALLGFRRLRTDYPDIEVVPLAVRGKYLSLVEWRCRNPSGFEAMYLNVHEFNDLGQLVEQVRFDGDDFEGAYRELEQRYYAGEGAAFAAGGARLIDCIIALNQGDFDKVFGELIAPDLYVTSRSRSVFGDRSAAEYRASQEELAAMVTSARSWSSAVEWLSPECCVVRIEREAVGRDGEQYAWTKIYPAEIRDGRVASLCEFEIENEQAAFAYAEELAAKGS